MAFSPEANVQKLTIQQVPILRALLAEGRTVTNLPFVGFSMLPMLRQGIDRVVLAPLPERLEKYDLPVYQYPSGKVVMHRVVAVKEDHYVCRGDNTYVDERITQDMLIGLVCAFKRGEKRIEVSDPMYRLYARFWVGVYPIRKPLVWLKRKIYALLRKLGFRRFWR